MKAKSKTTWKNLRAEDKPITLDTTLSLPEDDSGAWRHYRLSSRVICAHISSKCATDSAGSSAAVGVCGWPRPSMCVATYLPSLFACFRRSSSSCFRLTSLRILVPIMKANAAAISAAATMRGRATNTTPPRGAALREMRPWSTRSSWPLLPIEELAFATGQAENEINCGKPVRTSHFAWAPVKLIVLGSAGRSVPRRRPRALPRDRRRPRLQAR